MKKIIIFTVVFITLATSIFVVSCKKENNHNGNTPINPIKNNVKELIINESNYKDYLDDPDVKFFFQDLSVAGIYDGESKSYIYTLCVTGLKGRMCRDFKSRDAACAWGAYCQIYRPHWSYYTINNETWDCVCRGIGCLAK